LASLNEVICRGALGNLELLIMNLPMAEERRQAVRYPLARLAKIQLAQGNPPRYWLVTDISDGGVRVNTYGFDLPDEFVLRLSGDGPAQEHISGDLAARR
jgi:hypothetical protein